MRALRQLRATQLSLTAVTRARNATGASPADSPGSSCCRSISHTARPFPDRWHCRCRHSSSSRDYGDINCAADLRALRPSRKTSSRQWAGPVAGSCGTLPLHVVWRWQGGGVRCVHVCMCVFFSVARCLCAWFGVGRVEALGVCMCACVCFFLWHAACARGLALAGWKR